jgi:hypothetical protein
MANVVEENALLVCVKFVEDAISADPQSAFNPTLKSVVGKGVQPCSHLIDLALDGLAHRGRQGIERRRESGRPDLEGGRHNLTGLSCCELARCDFAPRVIQLGFHFIRQFKTVLETFIDPITNLLEFSARQLWNRRLDFFDRAHDERLADSLRFGKFGVDRALSDFG